MALPALRVRAGPQRLAAAHGADERSGDRAQARRFVRDGHRPLKLAPDAMDDVNAAAFAEAHKDSNNTFTRVTNQRTASSRPIRARQPLALAALLVKTSDAGGRCDHPRCTT